MAFEDLINQLRNPGEDGPPATIYDDLYSAYRQDVSVRDAKVSDSTSRIQELEAELSRQKVINYDMMVNSGAGGNDPDADDDDKPGTDDKVSGIASLFERRK